MLRLGEKARKLFAVGFVAGIGTIGVQDVDADGATDFTVRGRRRPMVERPVEPDEPDGDASPFCVLDIETLLSHRLSNEGGLNLPCLVE